MYVLIFINYATSINLEDKSTKELNEAIQKNCLLLSTILYSEIWKNLLLIRGWGGGVKARKEEGYVIQTYQCSMSSVERSDNSCRGEETRPP